MENCRESAGNGRRISLMTSVGVNLYKVLPCVAWEKGGGGKIEDSKHDHFIR